MEVKQLNIFGELETVNTDSRGVKQRTFEDYDGFVNKFKAKKTTDDCYTPPTIYEIVKEWTVQKFGLQGCEIMRPFYPGGDFINERYGKNCVVIDNPPFSIMKKICDWYNEHGVRYLLFCPALSSLYSNATFVAVRTQIRYENNAQVNTAFVTNMAGGLIAMTAPDLSKALNEEIKRLRADSVKVCRKVAFPDSVLRVFDLQRLAHNGVYFEVSQSEGVVCSKVCDYSAFGNSILISEGCKQRRKVAEIEARNNTKREVEEKELLRLSYSDIEIINKLNSKILKS